VERIEARRTFPTFLQFDLGQIVPRKPIWDADRTRARDVTNARERAREREAGR